MTPDQFRDPMFLRVRRQVALLRLPYAEGRARDMLEEAVSLYDDLLAERTARPLPQ